MITGDFHIHTVFSDGTSTPDSYIEAALEEDIPVLGFACHAPTPFECPWTISPSSFHTYLHELDRLQKRYSGQIEIYKGVNLDYLPVWNDHNIRMKNYLNMLDYIIGSVHFADEFNDGRPWEITGNPAVFNAGIHEIFNGNVKHAVTRYFELIREMIVQMKPDMVAHLDLIRMQNQTFPYFSEEEKWYRKEMVKTLHLIRETDTLMEINTRPVYSGNMLNTFPSHTTLAEAGKMGIRMVLNSNAHDPAEIAAGYEYATALLLQSGIRTVWVLYDECWQAVPVNFKGQYYYGYAG